MQNSGTKIYNGGLGVDYPKDVRHLLGSYSAEGNITYASNGDGTVTIYLYRATGNSLQMNLIVKSL